VVYPLALKAKSFRFVLVNFSWPAGLVFTTAPAFDGEGGDIQAEPHLMAI